MEHRQGAAISAPLLGLLPVTNPELRHRCDLVDDVHDPAFLEATARLRATLDAFRAAYGFGRAIAAPQLGVPLRCLALRLPGWPDLLVNPELVWQADDTFTMWDDCMSFPDLLVRLRRRRSIAIRYLDAHGAPRETPPLDLAVAELLQHEIDHFDGILALDRAIDPSAVVRREAFDAEPARFRAMVDYVIAPP